MTIDAETIGIEAPEHIEPYSAQKQPLKHDFFSQKGDHSESIIPVEVYTEHKKHKKAKIVTKNGSQVTHTRSSKHRGSSRKHISKAYNTHKPVDRPKSAIRHIYSVRPTPKKPVIEQTNGHVRSKPGADMVRIEPKNLENTLDSVQEQHTARCMYNPKAIISDQKYITPQKPPATKGDINDGYIDPSELSNKSEYDHRLSNFENYMDIHYFTPTVVQNNHDDGGVNSEYHTTEESEDSERQYNTTQARLSPYKPSDDNLLYAFLNVKK